VGDVNPRGGVVPPTLRGTVGLMESSCDSDLCGPSATGAVSATPGTRLVETVSGLRAACFGFSEVVDTVLRGICSGAEAG